MFNISKSSNFTGLQTNQDLETYVTTLDKDIRGIYDYLRKLPEQYKQTTEPTLTNSNWGFWHNTTNDKKYLLWKTDDAQVKVELT